MGNCVSSKSHEGRRNSKEKNQQPWSVRTSSGGLISIKKGEFQTVSTAKNSKSAVFDEINYISSPIPDDIFAEQFGLWRRHLDVDVYADEDSNYQAWLTQNGTYDTDDETGPWSKHIKRNIKQSKPNLEIVTKVTVLDKDCMPKHKEVNAHSEYDDGLSDHYDDIDEDLLYEKHVTMPLPVGKTKHNSSQPPNVVSVFEENIKIFRPLIVRNVMVKDILPYLPFLEDHDELYAAVARSPIEAMCILLEEIFKSPVVNKWDIFLEGLYQSGYKYIEQNLRGYSLIDHKYQEDYLKTLIPKFSKLLDVREVIDHLCAADLLNDPDRQEIDREELNKGKIAAAILLLARITRKHSHWYIKFIEVLKETGNEHLAEDLEIPEMLEIEVHKKSNTNTVESSNQYYLPPPPNTERNRRLPLPPSVAKPSAAEQFTSCKFMPLPAPPSPPPPLPPRVPIIHSKEKNKDLNCAEYDEPDTSRVRVPPRPKQLLPPPPLSNEYETYEDSPMSESNIPVRTVQVVDEVYDDFNEYETYSSTNDDNQNQNKDDNLIMPRKCSSTDLNIEKLPCLKYLFTEINTLQKEQSELNYAIKLKQKRSTIQEAMINDMRINRSLDLENETRRKEIEALKTGNVNPENTSDTSHVNALINTNHTKVTLDLREDVLQSLPYIPSPQMERFLSNSSDLMVKLYDPQSFHRVKSMISDRDSAIYFGNYA